MVEPLRHRRTKGAETDMLGLTLSRATPRLYRYATSPRRPECAHTGRCRAVWRTGQLDPLLPPDDRGRRLRLFVLVVLSRRPRETRQKMQHQQRRPRRHASARLAARPYPSGPLTASFASAPPVKGSPASFEVRIEQLWSSAHPCSICVATSLQKWERLRDRARLAFRSSFRTIFRALASPC